MLNGVSETVRTAGGLVGEATGAAQAVPSYSWTGYFMSLALMFVMLAILWFGARFLRQKGRLRLFGQTAELNVEARLAISARRHLLVVRYRNKRLLLGVTEQNISLLSEDGLEESEAMDYAEDSSAVKDTGITGKFNGMPHDFNKAD